ncbi:hypothetical protein CBR_g47130 [Chara braunii]|uniref:Right handed beta helix domain-containing protein n=1 Tax=Chara braunii TaxID=69332 RepID=A0A388M1K9_CHABU|nr:hypothetical protein CBR_g47130 [Chara braunii]|eukprot:GBG88431.1 hypothetical protein CBR_g47130 [Chara braunii]
MAEGGGSRSGVTRKRNRRAEGVSATNLNALGGHNFSHCGYGTNTWTAAKFCRTSRRIALLLIPIYLCVFFLGPCAVSGMRDTWHGAWAGSNPPGAGFTRGGTRYDSFNEGPTVSASTVKAAAVAVEPNATGETPTAARTAAPGGEGGGKRKDGRSGDAEAGKEDSVGREIVITSNMQVLEEFKVADKLTIRGDPKLCPNRACSISANAVTRVFHVYEGGSLTLINLVVTRGFSHLNGGAVFLEAGGKLNATEVAFSRNSVWDGSGGAVYVARGATADFTRCLFIANSAIRGHGGAAYIGRTGKATIKGCAFEKNAGKSSRKQDIYAAKASAVSLQFCRDLKPWTAGIGNIKFEEIPEGACVKSPPQPIRVVRPVDNMARAGEAR